MVFAEEQVLEAIGSPEIEKHKEQHRSLAEKAVELASQFDQGGLAIGDLFSFLIHYVILIHMVADDRDYFPYPPYSSGHGARAGK